MEEKEEIKKTDAFEIPENLESNDDFNKDQSNSKKTLTSSLMFKFLAVFGIAFTCFILIFQIILTPVQIIGLSMYPTLNAEALSDTDNIHTDTVFTISKNSYLNDEIVVIQNPNSKYIADNQQVTVSSIIKRIVATEGQTIVFFPVENYVVDPDVYYYDFKVLDKNGTEVILDNSYKPETMFFTRFVDSSSYNFSSYAFYYSLCEKLYQVSEGLSTDEIKFTIPKDSYFVIGDNRNHSTDSRFFGFVDEVDIMGSVSLHLKYGDSIFTSIWNKLKTIF